MVEHVEPENPDRRAFLKKACAVGVGTVIVAAPIAAGVAVLTDPLRRKAAGLGKILVTNLESLPENGLPRKFSILATREDAWNRSNNVPVGAIYLRRTGPETVEALNVICPHAGCFVDFRGAEKDFYCPCHNSSFALDGAISDPKSPSPRGMDSLAVEIRNGSEVWVEFVNYQTGHAEKIPVA